MSTKTNWNLYFSAADGNVEDVKGSLQQNTLTNWQNPYSGRTALHVASQKGHQGVVRELLKRPGVLVDVRTKTRGATALMLAIQVGNKECVELLVKAGADLKLQDDNGRTALEVAEEQGHTELLPLLTPKSNQEKTSKAWYKLKKYRNVHLIQTASDGWNEDILDKVCAAKQAIVTVKSPSRMQEDDEHLLRLYQLAEDKEWKPVLDMIHQKPYLLNAIPTDKTWSLLHLATLQNDIGVVTSLLEIPNCDVHVKSKQCKEDKVSWTPLELATRHNCTEVKTILEEEDARIGHDPNSEPITFIDQERGERYITKGIPQYMLLGIEFLDRKVLKGLDFSNINSYLDLTCHLFQVIVKEWQSFRDTISDCTLPFDKCIADGIKVQSDVGGFLGEIIRVYTTRPVYKQMTESLRKPWQALSTQITTTELNMQDVLLSLYSSTLHCVLLHWDQLPRSSGTVHHASILEKDEVDFCKVGVQLFCIPFIHRSRTKKKISFCLTSSHHGDDGEERQRVLFIINNRNNKSVLSPRDVGNIQQVPNGQRLIVYPAGVKFKVTAHRTSVYFSGVRITLEVIDM